MHDEEVPAAPLWVWILLIVIAGISFWCQATVTEERFVPALNYLSNVYGIPDDVAGATLMAAGASSPELLSSFIALFITHSALGLGTIVGSEIFNQLIICAGAVYAARSGSLQLDPAILAREVGFYGLSILFLYIALHDRRPADDDDVGDDHIFITFGGASLLFGTYIVYVLVCAFFPNIVAFFSGKKKESASADEKKSLYGSLEQNKESFHLPDMPFLRESGEPIPNFSQKEQISFGRTPTGGELIGSYQAYGSLSSIQSSLRKFSDGASLRRFLFIVEAEKPSDTKDVHDLEFNALDERMSCFLWQRSYFYNKARSGKQCWHLRWFSFTKDRIFSVPNRTHYNKHTLKYPKFDRFDFDDKRLIIRIPNIKSSRRQDFYLMAPSHEVFQAVVQRIETLVKHWENETPLEEGSTRNPNSEPGYQEEEFDGSSDPYVDLTDPSDASNVGLILFLFLYPFRWIMQMTIKDVRKMDNAGNPTATVLNSYFAIGSCLCWLIVGSYAMVASLEHLAALMQIPDSVIGFTVSAAGTSLPNYVASKVAAQHGLGNMAVSNAFGSNTFNILVGLGLPWVLYIATTGFHPYHQLHDDGITSSVIILASVLAAFIFLVVPSGFVIYRGHGTFFIFLYLSYLAFAIGEVYL